MLQCFCILVLCSFHVLKLDLCVVHLAQVFKLPRLCCHFKNNSNRHASHQLYLVKQKKSIDLILKASLHFNFGKMSF